MLPTVGLVTPPWVTLRDTAVRLLLIGQKAVPAVFCWLLGAGQPYGPPSLVRQCRPLRAEHRCGTSSGRFFSLFFMKILTAVLHACAIQ
jgi:hypothetical protein